MSRASWKPFQAIKLPWASSFSTTLALTTDRADPLRANCRQVPSWSMT